MVMVDNLTKAAYFIPIKSTHKVTNITKIYMKEVAIFHGIHQPIV
jgi:hypothetical protein